MRKRLLPRISRLAAVLVVAHLAHGQSFDAASVKPAAGGRYVEPSGGPGTKDPGRIHYANMSLQNLLLMAYDIQVFQLAGPNWLDTERFDIDAVLPADSTAAQFHAMLRNLLANRFQLQMHRETRDVSGYDLVAAKGGAKVKPSATDLAAPPDPSEERPHLNLGKDGFFVPPRHPGMFLQMVGMNAAREDFLESSMAELAKSIQDEIHRPVTDATGLAGKYDFTLTFAVEGLDMGRGRRAVGPNALENPPDIFNALRSQAGLRLDSRKAPVELLVIDHAEKTPTEN